MFTLNEVESKLKEINENFTVVANPTNELASVYFKGACAYISMPKAYVKETRDEGYVDDYGRPHRSLTEVLAIAKQFVVDMENPEYARDILQTNEEFEADIRAIEKKQKQDEIAKQAAEAIKTDVVDVTQPIEESKVENLLG